MQHLLDQTKKVTLNASHKAQIIDLIKMGKSKQEVFDQFEPLITGKPKLAQFVAQVPSAQMRAKWGVMNYSLAAIIGFMLILNVLGSNYISTLVDGILLYLVVTFQTYHYHWLVGLSGVALIPTVILTILAFAQGATTQVMGVIFFGLFLGVLILVFSIILSTKLSTKFTAKYFEEKNKNGGTTKYFKYIFLED